MPRSPLTAAVTANAAKYPPVKVTPKLTWHCMRCDVGWTSTKKKCWHCRKTDKSVSKRFFILGETERNVHDREVHDEG